MAVILFGFTAILGRLIELSGPTLVFWRMLLTTLSLLMVVKIFKEIRKTKGKDLRDLVLIGFLVALHWVTFFSAIKLSNVTVTLSVFGTTTFMTALLQPLLLRTKLQWFEVSLGVLVIVGVYLVFRFTEFYTEGIIVALISAFLASTFGVLNKKMVSKHDPLMITFVELGSGWFLVALLLPFYFYYFPEEVFLPSKMDWLWLSILAFVCTSIAYVITLRALKVLTPFIISLSINLEPIYGILMALMIFAEHKELEPQFFIGTGLILLSVLLHPLLDKKFNRVVTKR